MKRLIIIIAVVYMTLGMQAQEHNGVVDVHCHIITPGYLAALERHNAMLDEGFPLPAWSVDEHLAMMDHNGISVSILTMPAPQPWWGDAAESAKVMREVNESCAEIQRQYPDRFRFAASLPLPDVNLAIREAVYSLDTLGAVEVKLATNARGQYLGDKALEPLMEILDMRGATIIIHPHKPVPVNDDIMATTPLAVYEYPAETTRAVINMIANGVTTRYPHIKWIVPHCGSFLPLAIARMKGVLPIMINAGKMKSVDWETATDNIYYDLAGNLTPSVLAALLTITTPDHLVYGSDYPYVNDKGVEMSKAKLNDVLKGNTSTAASVGNILTGTALINTQCKEPMQADGIVRLSKVEVDPQYLDEYIRFATEVGEISLRTESGVLTMYAVAEKENPCSITILETYSSQEAYRRHIASAHFQKYKQGTLHMVKSLVLLDQIPLNPANRINNFIIGVR